MPSANSLPGRGDADPLRKAALNVLANVEIPARPDPTDLFIIAVNETMNAFTPGPSQPALLPAQEAHKKLRVHRVLQKAVSAHSNGQDSQHPIHDPSGGMLSLGEFKNTLNAAGAMLNAGHPDGNKCKQAITRALHVIEAWQQGQSHEMAEPEPPTPPPPAPAPAPSSPSLGLNSEPGRRAVKRNITWGQRGK